MAMVGLLLKDKSIHEDADFSQITVLQDWCQASKQKMSTAKTKEPVIQTKPNGTSNIHHVTLHNQPVEQVEHFKQ